MAVANYESSSVSILLGNGNGTFNAVPTSPSTYYDPFALALADFNRDGRLDIAAPTTITTVS